MKRIACIIGVLALAMIVVAGAVFASSTPETKVAALARCNTYTFDSTKSYDPNNEKISIMWDLGDGTTSTDRIVTHTYEKAGDYTVTLTVKDTSGLKCDTAVTTQKVKINVPPVPSFTAAEAVCVGDTVTFDASATTDDTPGALTYAWDFGDGSTGEGKIVTHTYAKGGRYAARLTADDNAGTQCSVASVSKMVSVNGAPTVDAGPDIATCLKCCNKYTVKLCATGSDPDGDVLTYTWDFGDGTTGKGKCISHTYPKGGSYVARVTVDDGRGSPCSVASDTVNVRMNSQPKAVAGPDIVGCVGDAIAFDASASNDPDGDALKYMWDFGDGTTGEGMNASHVYQTGGSHKVGLTVDDGQGTECSKSSSGLKVTLNSPPVAMLAAVDAACAGTKINFDASGSKDPDNDTLKYTWDFGDGTVVEDGAKVSHLYKQGGSYMVKVTVDDRKGTPCSTAIATTPVKLNTPPVADAGPNTVCCMGETSVFDGSKSNDADGDRLTYRWDFGDGETADTAKATHVYKKGGVYRVSLTVDDNSGTPCSRSTSGFTAQVNETPVAVIDVR